jgi:Nucleotidyl transferase AbiEii toxin, Type IV TA system
MKDRPRQYLSAASFRVALETRLKSIAADEGVDLQRIRRQVSFDRLLARLFSPPNAPWLLKGGYAMELRSRSARATKDIDLSLPVGTANTLKANVLSQLQSRAAIDLGDFFVFTVGQPLLALDAAPEGGSRYPVIASLAGRRFTQFHLDVGVGDAAIPPTEILEVRDWLAFAGIAPVSCIAISKEQQFAEKIHAYTLNREHGVNSRVKDLVDLALLVTRETMNRQKTEKAIRTTFALRQTHAIPESLAEPPNSWEVAFRTMAEECQLDLSLAEAFEIIRSRRPTLRLQRDNARE